MCVFHLSLLSLSLLAQMSQSSVGAPSTMSQSPLLPPVLPHPLTGHSLPLSGTVCQQGLSWGHLILLLSCNTQSFPPTTCIGGHTEITLNLYLFMRIILALMVRYHSVFRAKNHKSILKQRGNGVREYM